MYTSDVFIQMLHNNPKYVVCSKSYLLILPKLPPTPAIVNNTAINIFIYFMYKHV